MFSFEKSVILFGKNSIRLTKKLPFVHHVEKSKGQGHHVNLKKICLPREKSRKTQGYHIEFPNYNIGNSSP